jgi:hypothetical protein
MNGINDSIPMEQMADALGISVDNFVRQLKRDGILEGNTQSRIAHRFMLFEAEEGAYRSSGGLIHKSNKFNFMVRPHAQLMFLAMYGHGY